MICSMNIKLHEQLSTTDYVTLLCFLFMQINWRWKIIFLKIIWRILDKLFLHNDAMLKSKMI